MLHFRYELGNTLGFIEIVLKFMKMCVDIPADGEPAEANMRKKSAGNGNRTKCSPTENYSKCFQ